MQPESAKKSLHNAFLGILIIITMKLPTALFVIATGLAVSASAQTLPNYQAAVTGQSPSDYFKLDGSLESAVNPGIILGQNLTPNGGFAADVYGNVGKSFFYVIQGDYLAYTGGNLLSGGGVSNLVSTAKGSISFLFRTLPPGVNTGQRYVFSAGGDATEHNALSLFLENNNIANGDPNSYKLRFGNTTVTVLPAANVVPSTWYYFALTYDESTAAAPNKATWYLGPAGGSLISGVTTNSPEAVAGDALGSLYIGSHTNGNAGFRSPGSGRLDEFAIWHRILSPAEIASQYSKLPAFASGVMVTNIIVNDSFADANRTNTGPLQADWWSSSTLPNVSVAAYPNKLRLVSGTSGRGMHGTFAPQTLAVGDTIRVTYTFTTPATVGTAKSTAFKVGLMDFNNAGLANDLLASSSIQQPLYTNLPGYMADMDVNTGVTADISIREHIPNTTGFFLGTTGEWVAKGSSADANYAFAPNTQYTGVFSVTRTELDGVDIFGSISQGATLMDSYWDSDASGIANHFGMVGFWVNSATFGSTITQGELEDNGITFSNIKVEVVTVPPPVLTLTQSGSNVVLSWPTAGAAGYNLESTLSLSTPVWTGAGAPTVVGSNNYVTNAAVGDAKYYRLKK